MALTVAGAVALASWCAVVAAGGATVGAVHLTPAQYGLALVPGLVLAAARPVPPAWAKKLDVRGLGWLSMAAATALSMTLRTSVAERLDVASPVLALAVLPLSLLWPQPLVLRYCLVLSLLSVVASNIPLAGSLGPLAGMLAATVVALVAGNRLATDSLLQLTTRPPPTRRRATARDAGLVAAVVALAVLAAAALLPPPTGAQPAAGGGPGAERPSGGSTGPPSPLLLGGAVDIGAAREEPGHQVVLLVTAPGPDVWRAQALDGWDGRTWRPSSSSPLPEATGTSPDFEHRVTVKAEMATVLVAAPAPVRTEVPEGVTTSAGGGSVRPLPPLGRGDSYVVASRRARPPASELRALGSRPGSPPSPAADEAVRLPVVSERVRALAADITAGAATDYDRAAAVERWLARHTTVTATASALPAGTDAVDAYLFGDRSGPADRSATAMAVMLRTVGVPARLGVGFLPGRRTLLGGEYVVRASDAHAWTEVWFQEAGWQRFDPSGLIARAQREDSLRHRSSRVLAQLLRYLGVAVVLFLTWLVARRLRQWRRRRRLGWSTRFFARLSRAGAARGRPHRPAETAAEYAAALAGSVLPDERLHRVGAVVTVAAYSGRPPSPEDQEWAEEVLREAEAAAPRRRRACPPAFPSK